MNHRRILLFALGSAVACSDPGLPPVSNVRDAGDLVVCDDDNPCPTGMTCVASVCEMEARDAGMTAAGRVQVDPEELDFGAFVRGLPIELNLTVENVGEGDLELLALEIEQNVSGEFQLEVSGEVPRTLARGETAIARVIYTARDVTEDRDRLRVVTDDPEQPIVIVPLIAEYKGQTEIAVVEDAALDRPEVIELDFGSTPIGADTERTVFIKNIGTGNAVLEIASVRTDPNPSLVFEVETSTSVPVYLAPEIDVVEVTVTFAPRNTGLVEELLVIGNDDGNGDESPYLIRLIGEGIQAGHQVTPDPIQFGTVFVGYPEDIPVSIESIGADVLELFAVSLAGTPPAVMLSATSTLPRSLTTGETFDVLLTADPGSAGSLAGLLRIESNDPDLPVREVRIEGEALIPPEGVTSVPSVDFGEVHVFRGPGQVTTTVTVQNDGGSPLFINQIAMTTQSSTEFSVMPSAAGPLDPGESVDLTVAYAPLALGTHTGTVAIDTNDPARPSIQIPVHGTGIDPTVFLFKSTVPPVPPSPIDFGAIYRGSIAAPVTLTLQNAGVGTLVVLDIVRSAGSSMDFTLTNTPTFPVMLPPGATTTVDIGYAPATVGQDSGAILITTNDRDTPSATIDLAGEGVGCAPNTWDIDMNPANGCEYTCTLATPAVEACNGADDDCNGTIDEGFSLGNVCSGVGQCGGGVIECTPDGTASTCSTNPGQSQDESAVEVCNTFDDDCDGTPDNGFDLTNDLNNCGACNVACTVQNGAPVCATGNCAIQSCTAPFDDCNNQYGDGCESNTQVDLANCGACNVACAVANGSPICNGGSCAVAGCNAGFFDCNGGYADGCEADLQNSVTTCGSCSTVCSVANGSPACNAGNCAIATCVAPWDDCNGQYVDGCEINTSGNVNHCGGCNQACAVANGAPACSAGNCAIASCTAPFENCNGQYADGCEANLNTSVNTCGACNVTCTVANGTPGCNAGSCEVASCSGTFDDCNGQYGDGCETNLANNVLNCGGCNIACAVANGAPTCNLGMCGIAACTAPWEDCNGQYADGCESNTSSSLQHCGGCNQACAVANGTPTCNAGSCQIQACTAPFDDCNNNPADGCEIDTNNNVNHCGFCGNVCSLANAVPTCNGTGACAIASCNGTFEDCNGVAADGCEADLANDLATCGGCNMPCALANASESCNAGVCTFVACDAGWVDLDQNPANGCEYSCTVVPGVDLPDPGLVDSDCDGIDGDLSAAIFVSPLGADGNTGLFGSPVRTIARGILRAQSNGFTQVLVAGGIYPGVVNISNGISLYAGYDATNWSRDYSNATVITGGPIGSNLFGVRAENINLSTRFDGFTITLGNNNSASGSVYGVYVRNANNQLILSNLDVTSGDGGDGNDGGNGSNGASGGNGGAGQAGCDACSSNGFGGGGGASSCGRTGGGGGRGGYDNGAGANGVAGNAGGAGGGGGLGARSCDSGGCSSCEGRVNGLNGANGSLGALGSAGANGGGGNGNGGITGNLWVGSSGGNGVDGLDGRGGGGGGGGGGGADDCYENVFTCFELGNLCDRDRGGGGGGGGGGGCGGTRGTGGQAGGGTFGVFLVGSSPVLTASSLTVGRGGDGGNGGTGGNGGAGGAGGTAGAAQDDSGRGGFGASGRPGGRGGHGGGGGGGVAYGVYRASGSNPALSNLTYSVTGGGFGGTSTGPNGANGASGNVF
ncbi:MAG: choice-of-anchor D domain-containing protein [Deltaproteobacteria bacterium]|jgi:hypothetical protein